MPDPTTPKPFKFKGKDGKSYPLPLATEARKLMTGQDLRDAATGGDMGVIAYLFKALEAVEPKPESYAALLALPQDDAHQTLLDWSEHGDGDGASLGE